MHPLLTLFRIIAGPGTGAAPRQSIGCSVLLTGTRSGRCPGCQNIRPQKIDWNGFATILGKDATFFPHRIGGFDQLISDEMRCDLVDNGVTGFVAHPIRIAAGDIESEVLRTLPIPQYYLLQAIGVVDIDRQLFDEYDGDLCEVCHNWTPRPGGKYRFGSKVHMPVLKTWDGSDLVAIRNKINGGIYCSRKVVDLAIKKEWTGFGIEAFTDGLPRIDLTNPNWAEDLEVAVAKRFPGVP
jgi:hypothetical protein